MSSPEILKILPVRFPREACRTCPACAEWMAQHGTRKTGRASCQLCHGDGRVPYMYLPPERFSGRKLTIVKQGNIPFLKPVFGQCKQVGQHRAMQTGTQVRCAGCDDLCIMPENIQAGDLITTDTTTKRRGNGFYPLKTAL